ncbi:MAG: hypothetical protein NTY09_13145 [bacterium]|nr:hypothetical protein [bacterium]
MLEDDSHFKMEYDLLCPRYNRFLRKLVVKLKRYFNDLDHKPLCIEYRVKAFDRVIEKCRKKKFKNIQDIQDIGGIRIIVNYRDEIPVFKSFLEMMYITSSLRSEKRMQSDQLERFGYDEYHIALSPHSIDGDLSEFSDLRIEVQLRTILEHAWCIKNHEFYKDEILYPEVQREMNGYRALIENADNALKRLRDRFHELKRLDMVFENRDFENYEISLESLKRYSIEILDLRKWYDYGIKAGMKHGSYEQEKNYSNKILNPYNEFHIESLLNSLHENGICTLGQLENYLRELENQIVSELPSYITYAESHYNGIPIADPFEILISMTNHRSDKTHTEYKWIGMSIGGSDLSIPE